MRYPYTYFGMDIIVDDEVMSKWVEDWSKVRSPGRALRRRKRGFRQNIQMRKVPKPEFIQIGNKLIVHSEMLRELEKKLSENRT